jgi:hypothetical protein
MMSMSAADKLEFGWGIHIIEGPNKPVLALLVAVIITLSFATSVTNHVYMHNTDSGFAIGQWIVGTLTTILAAIYYHP